ncbi:MAG: polyribonucleotide nucleotidyltransferase [bacterium]
MQKTFKSSELGFEVEIGKFARQADGAVWLKNGKNIVLSTVVMSKEAKEFMGFLPLTIEYRERTSAAGKIPGGFIKREGRLSENEILSSRLIDRPIRPLFPKYFFHELQSLSTIFSSDGKFPTDVLALIGTSLAFTISTIPFLGPVGAVQITKINGEWQFNVSSEDVFKSDANIVIAGTKDGICMVEGYGNNLSEEKFIELLLKAEVEIKKQIDWQLDIAKELNIEKISIEDPIDWSYWEDRVKEYLKPELVDSLFIADKKERNKAIDNLRNGLYEFFSDELKNGKISYAVVLFLFDSELKEIIPDLIARKNIRVDGRKLNEVRSIYSEVGTLPCVHGSSLFQRGETQVLSSLTLGTSQDAQIIEPLIGQEIKQSFMIHYNFPPFATGEIKPMRGVSRREIGHGHLAQISFKNVLPEHEAFPYTIRSICDVLESNGSSSMATVCSTTLSLMDAGVPIKESISGIAMGLMKDSAGKFYVLTDILGMEDGLGLMDFKVSGSKNGIMAIQMDVKAKSGLTKDILTQALKQAKDARLHILSKMNEVLASPRKEISKLAPQITSFSVEPDKIGAIIGPGGKNIKEIIATTGAEIDIEDNGIVNVYAKTSESADAAIKWIKTLVGDIEVGSVWDGTIAGFADFGIFVDLIPGKSGLIHISAIDKDLLKTLTKKYKTGDKLTVKVLDYDKYSGKIRLIAPELSPKAKK